MRDGSSPPVITGSTMSTSNSGAYKIFEGDLDASTFEEYSSAERVAIDTETSGLSWATDRLHLLQLSTPSAGASLVRLSGHPAPRLTELIESRDTVKLFHFAPFDLRFATQLGVTQAQNIRCTKTASKLLEPKLNPKQHSLGALLFRKIGVEIPKGEARTSDWSAKLLSETQIRYAIDDVTHLERLYLCLERELEERSLVTLYRQICDYIPVDALLETSGVPDPLSY